MVKHNVTIEDSSPLVIYPELSLWKDSPRTPDLKNYTGDTPLFPSNHRTNASATAEFSFNGTGVYVFGTKGPAGGTYNITLSAASPNLTSLSQTFDPATYVGTSKASTTAYQQLLFSSSSLNASFPHHLQIGNYGFGEFILDFILVENEVNGTGADVQGNGNATMEGGPVRRIRIDDTSSEFDYQGSGWSSDVSGNRLKDLLLNETQHSTADPNASVSLRFRGSGVELHGQYQTGTYTAQLDGGPVVPINPSYQGAGPKSRTRPRELIFFADGLQEDNHQLLVINQGGSDTGGLNVDFAVVSTTDPDNTTGSSTAAFSMSLSKSVGHSVPVGAIAGGVVGVLALLVVAVLGMWYLRVYRRRQASNARAIDLNDEGNAEFGIEKSAPWEMQPPPPHPFLLGRPASPTRRERSLPPLPAPFSSPSPLPREPNVLSMPSPPPGPPPPNNSPNVHYLSPNEMDTSLDAFAVRSLLVQAMLDDRPRGLPASPHPALPVSLSRNKSDARSSYSLPSAALQGRRESGSRFSTYDFPLPPPRSQYQSTTTLGPNRSSRTPPDRASYMDYYTGSAAPRPRDSAVRHESDAGFSLDYTTLPRDSSIPPPTPARTSFRRSSLLPPAYERAWAEKMAGLASLDGGGLLTPRTKAAFKLVS